MQKTEGQVSGVWCVKLKGGKSSDLLKKKKKHFSYTVNICVATAIKNDAT